MKIKNKQSPTLEEGGTNKKIKVEIKEIDTKKENINETGLKACPLFEKINKIGKSLSRLIKKKRKGSNKNRNEETL